MGLAPNRLLSAWAPATTSGRLSLTFRTFGPALVLPSAIFVAAAGAQDAAVPVRNAGVTQGITVGADLGFGRIKRSGTPGDDRSRAIALGASAGFGPLGVTIAVSRVTLDPAVGGNQGSSVLTGSAQFTVIGGPLVPLKVVWQAGADRSLTNGGAGSPWRGWAGIGAALSIPAAVLSIKPWIAPRLDYIGSQSVTGGRIKAAVSAGIDLGLLNGWGLRVGYDSRLGWRSGGTPASGVSIGTSYHFR